MNEKILLVIGAVQLIISLILLILITKKNNEKEYSELLAAQEELKTMPFADVWEEYCSRQGVIADRTWLDEVKKYESEVLSKR